MFRRQPSPVVRRPFRRTSSCIASQMGQDQQRFRFYLHLPHVSHLPRVPVPLHASMAPSSRDPMQSAPPGHPSSPRPTGHPSSSRPTYRPCLPGPWKPSCCPLELQHKELLLMHRRNFVLILRLCRCPCRELLLRADSLLPLLPRTSPIYGAAGLLPFSGCQRLRPGGPACLQ
jgi:hypothetical protein